MNEPVRKYLGLELLRGLCAIGIAAYHFVDWSIGYDLQSLGMFGVYIFFVLSALVLMIRYHAVFGNYITLGDLNRFYRNRAARILPLLALMASFTYFYLQWRSGEQSIGKAILTGSGLFALHMPGFLSNTPGAWSLGIELAFYAIFPIVCLSLSAAPPWKLLALTVLAICAQQIAIDTLPDSNDPTFWAKYSMPITFAPFFLTGILIHRLGRKPMPYALSISFLCVAVIAGFSWFAPADLFRGGAAFLLLSGLTTLAVFFAFQAELSGWCSAIAELLGNISYSIYLSHWLVFEAVFRVNSLSIRAILYAIAVPCLGSILYFGFERPLRDLLRNNRSKARQG